MCYQYCQSLFFRRATSYQLGKIYLSVQWDLNGVWVGMLRRGNVFWPMGKRKEVPNLREGKNGRLHLLSKAFLCRRLLYLFMVNRNSSSCHSLPLDKGRGESESKSCSLIQNKTKYEMFLFFVCKERRRCGLT